MVKVKYFPHAVNGDCYVYTVNRLAEFLQQPQFDRQDLVNMRFFHGDILGKEVDTEDGSFLNICNGEITVIDGRTFPGDPVTVAVTVAVSFVATAVITAVLMPKPSIPDVAKSGSRKQPSSTNALSDTSNKPRVNQRIDDIFGTVNKHTPPLWQAPYRVGVNDQETEVLLLCVGRGKYDIDVNRIYDGDTRYRDIPGAQVNIYEPGFYPGNGSPSQTLGGLIDDPIGIYRESNDLNPTELLPPNELFFGEGARFKASKVGDNTVFTVTNVSGDLRDKFSVGGTLVLEEAFLSESTGTFRLYRDTGDDVITRDFVTQNLINISGGYDITNVTSDTVTVSGISETFPDDSPLVLDYIEVVDESENTLFFTYDINIETGSWYQTYNPNPDPELGEVMFDDPVSYFNLVKRPDVGETSNNFVGPITIPTGSSKILINLTSRSGYYKLDEGTEVAINADVTVEVDELREDGEPTGVGFTVPVTYGSNPSNTRFSVYRSYYIDIPYSNAQVSCKRNTNRDKSDGISNVDKIEWTLLYGFEPLRSGVDFGDVTLMHTLIPSNSQSRLVKERKTNLDVTRKITQYLGNGQFGTPESYATNQFEQILIHTALDPYLGRLNLEQIAADEILMLGNQVREYFNNDATMTSFGYDFDDDQIPYEEMFSIICNAVNCYPYVQSGVYNAFFDKPQPTSTLQITHRNKIPDSETREDVFERKNDGIELTYRDNDTGVNETIYIPTDRSATRPERIEAAGVTTKLQAYRRALREYYRQRYQTVNTEFAVDEFGRMIVPGQRIDSPDGTRFVRHPGNTDGYRVYDGEVVEVNGLVVELSEPVQFVDGEDHYIQFTESNGDNSELIICTPGDDEFTVVLGSAPEQPVYDGYSRDRTKFTFCSEQARESIALIPQTIEFKLDEGQETNTIGCINYDSRYYQGDTETPDE